MQPSAHLRDSFGGLCRFGLAVRRSPFAFRLSPFASFRLSLALQGMARYVQWQNSLLQPEDTSRFVFFLSVFRFEELMQSRFVEIPALHQSGLYPRRDSGLYWLVFCPIECPELKARKVSNA